MTSPPSKRLLPTQNASASSPFLGGVPVFKEANSVLGAGVVEYFVNISDIAKLADDIPTPAVSAQEPPRRHECESHALDRRTCFSGRRKKLASKRAVLGDTSEAHLRHLGRRPGQAASIAYIPQTPFSYREFQVNLPGIYALAMTCRKIFSRKGDSGQNRHVRIHRARQARHVHFRSTHALTGEVGYLQSDFSIRLQQEHFLRA